MNLAYAPDQYIAFWSGAAAIAAIATGGVGIVTLLAIKRDSRDRTRPLMSADIVPVVLAHGSTELVVSNVGRSAARDVKVSFDPPIPDLPAEEQAGKLGPYIRRRYANAILTIPPGRTLRNVYLHLPTDAEDLPRDLTVTFDYVDSRGRDYHDAYALSVETTATGTSSSPSNTDEAGRQRRLLAALEAIARGVDRG